MTGTLRKNMMVKLKNLVVKRGAVGLSKSRELEIVSKTNSTEDCH